MIAAPPKDERDLVKLKEWVRGERHSEDAMAAATAAPEYNMTGQDYADRRHFRYTGPILDFHAHVMVTRPGDPKNAPPLGHGPGASTLQAETMLEVGRTFG